MIHNINQSDSKIISIDMPSGLFDEDNRKNNGAIIKARETYTFECMKLSLLLILKTLGFFPEFFLERVIDFLSIFFEFI